ncbi:MAG: hypothetical protein AAFO91_19280 [Bacteroidota bacterium]
MKKLPYVEGSINYYAFYLPGGKGNSPVAAAEMITSKNNTVTIQHWLNSFFHAVAQFAKVNVRHIETDFSYAMLHGVVMAANVCTLPSYIKQCYQITSGESVPVHNTTVHVGSAHALKAFTNKVYRFVGDKAQRDLFAYVFARLIKTKSMVEACNVYHHLCVVLLHPTMDARVVASLETLHEYISKVHVPNLESFRAISEESGSSP